MENSWLTPSIMENYGKLEPIKNTYGLQPFFP